MNAPLPGLSGFLYVPGDLPVLPDPRSGKWKKISKLKNLENILDRCRVEKDFQLKAEKNWMNKNTISYEIFVCNKILVLVYF